MSNTEKIDAYILGQMDAGEKEQFENELQTNAEIQKEFEFQKKVVKGIQQARVNELKLLLDSTTVGGTGLVGNMTLGKIAVGAMVLGGLFWGGWYLTQNPDNSSDAQIEQLAEASDEKEPQVTEEIEPISDSNQTENVVEPEESTQINETLSQIEKDETNSEESIQVQEPKITKPQVMEFDNESNNDSVNAPESTLVPRIDTNTSTLEVDVDNSKKKTSFHYKFSEGKLYLLGDFDSTLYEIIEVNNKASKSFFLLYNDKFYALDQTKTQATPLVEVNDPAIIHRLKEAKGLK